MAAPNASAWAADPVSFRTDVLPILAENCFACHGFDKKNRAADLRLDDRQAAVDHGAIVPGVAAASLLLERIASDDPDEVMPPRDSGKTLSAGQREVLRRWVEHGAEYEPHWAFAAAVPFEPPVVAAVDHPIDRFIRARLAEARLSPSPRAEAATLVRRVHLDLVGLPPSPADVEAFVRDPSADAYEKLVARLLESPHHGERWGRWWLDQARYADSHGYSFDNPRQIWKYRDWVINALNADMPFDRFTVEQLAGDLLPGATDDQRIATGFHRNTQINQEGGVDPEQFRIDAVFDRVATTGTVWLGLTIGCAQCHDHKFDPVEQREYYQFFAFFNDQDEVDLKVFDDGDTEAAKGVSTMVLAERKQPRKTTRFEMGDFTRPADEVAPGTPAILPPLKHGGGRPNRLDLARWLVDPANPLPARVIVNRVWQQYFGVGLVETENDFGLIGTPPSHPELLDWLACEFRNRGWSLKQLHRLIVTSETYRQSSVRRPDLHEVDPLNRLLARQQRLRMDAEGIRDMALAASGLLVPAIGGPPAFPPIPAGVTDQGQVKHAWHESTGDERYRRGLYTFRFRATPVPALAVFDAPDGYVTCTRRGRSNTPLQALTLLNDKAFFECAGGLENVIREDGLQSAFIRCTSRRPSDTELAVLARLDPCTQARVLLNLDEAITRE